MAELGADSAPLEVLRNFSGIAYRPDGAIDHLGNYTLFAHQQKSLQTPGLNCSGFVVAACRYFFKRNYHLDDVIHDRLVDSGPEAERGADWDFGYDLILNVTEGLSRRVVLPYQLHVDIATSNGAALRGFELHDFNAWCDIMAQMTVPHIYLFSMSKLIADNGAKLVHYHVGCIVPDASGHLWLAHATQKSGVTLVDIANSEGLKSVVEANPDGGSGQRKILLIEAAVSKD